MAQVVLANRLTDGRSVFLAADNAWVEALPQAELATSPAAAESLLARARAAEAANIIVDPYLVAVEEGPAGLRPSEWREQIRASGPTVHNAGLAPER